MSPPRPPRPPGTAVAGMERGRALTMVVVRVGALVLCGSLEVLGDGRWLTLGPLPYLLGAMGAVSLLVCVVTAARAALPPRWLLCVDLGLVTAAVLAAGHHAGSRVTDGWPGTVLPYVLLVGIMAGISFRTFPVVLAWTAALGGALVLGYVQSDLAWWAGLPHVAGLTTNATMAAYVMRILFRTAGDLDRARAEELRRSARVAEESQWLRAFLRGDDGDPAEDVVAALEEVVRQAVGSGLRVEFNAGRLRSAPEREGMPAEVVEALSGILREALTNVRKHAGVRHAVVRAECRSGTLALSVLDHGSGFDPDAPTTGLGIARSIRDSARAVGGSADVEAAPGEVGGMRSHRTAVLLAAAALALLPVTGAHADDGPADARPAGRTCSGTACDGKDPALTGCTAGSSTVASKWVRAFGGYLEPRYGPGKGGTCQVNWARFTKRGQGADYNVWVERRPGVRAAAGDDKSLTQYSGGDEGTGVIYSDQVCAPEVPARACVEPARARRAASSAVCADAV